MSFSKLDFRNGSYYWQGTEPFRSLGTMDQETLKKIFNFSYDMAFNDKHREYRSGGIKARKPGEIFADCFQGKLAEFFFYDLLKTNKVAIEKEPTLEIWDRGKWDDTDFEIHGVNISCKSTKHYSQLLLLEKKDYNNEGAYIPNNKIYDYTVLIRITPSITDIMKSKRLLYSYDVKRELLEQLIINRKFAYDIPGFIDAESLKQVIKDNNYIPQGAYLNRDLSKGKKGTKIDADNYYVQTIDLINIELLIDDLPYECPNCHTIVSKEILLPCMKCGKRLCLRCGHMKSDHTLFTCKDCQE